MLEKFRANVLKHWKEYTHVLYRTSNLQTHVLEGLILKHGTPECRNARTPERRNAGILKPGTQNYQTWNA